MPLALATVAILLGIASGTVYAHTKSSEGWVYRSSTDCVKGRSELSDGSGGGRVVGVSKAFYLLTEPAGHCLLPIEMATGAIRVRIKYRRWDGSQWMKWYTSGWRYTTRPDTRFTVVRVFGSTPHCGTGHYGVWAEAYVNNGGWHGGKRWSGSHDFS